MKIWIDIAFWKQSGNIYQKTKIPTAFALAILYLRILPNKSNIHKNVFARMFIVKSLFEVAKYYKVSGAHQ